jgi:CO/xanthine dehydrogenase FAD-binding subunit
MYAFEYQRAKSLADAASALARTGGKALAGGRVVRREAEARQPGHPRSVGVPG